MKKKLPIVFYVLLGLALAGLLALGYSHTALRGERRALEEKAGDLEKKIGLLEKKYSEKRALEQQLVRAKTQVEGQLRGLQAEMEKLRKEKEVLVEERNTLEEDSKKLKERLASSEAALKERTVRIENFKADWEGAEAKHAKATKEHQATLDRLNAERKQVETELQNALRSTQERLERSEVNNAKLAIIAEELAESYKNKGLTTSILQAEPFTQIRKVEMENLIEEYRERIDNEKLKKTGAKRP